MRSTHRVTVAVALAVAVAAGTAAATQTVNLGADAKETPAISASALAAEKAKLAAADRSIATALAERPPALPKLPRFEPLGEPKVAPLIVTRVIPLGSTTTAEAPDDSPSRETRDRRSPPADPAPAAGSPSPSSTRAPSTTPAPVRVADDEGEHHALPGDDDEDQGAEDREEDQPDHEAAEPEQNDD